MPYVADGVMLGLTLTILLGPIFVALTHTGIQHGIRAGIAVGIGIWISDIIVILGSYFFLIQISEIIHTESFRTWMGLVGGVVLMGSGVVTFFKIEKNTEKTMSFNARSYIGYFSKGFAVNFFNPFTFVFWMGLMTSYISHKGITLFQTFLLFGSILVTIMITDTLKVVLAKGIRKWLNHNHIQIFSKIAGVMLFIFGLVLLIRSGVM